MFKKNIKRKEIIEMLEFMGVSYEKVTFNKRVKLKDANGQLHTIKFSELYERCLKQIERDEEAKRLEEERVALAVEAEKKRLEAEKLAPKLKKPRKPRSKNVKSN